MMTKRKELIKAIVGSHNYNLNTIDSDKDYKVFTAPTFEDLYKGEMKSNQIIGDIEDLDYHDIRKIPNLWYKSNINFIELLYSKEIIISDNITDEQKSLINKLLSYKKDIVKMNLPYLYNACRGMHKSKMSALYKGTEGTQHLVDKFGYDTKEALHAYRVIDFIVRFEETNFNDFEKAITYNDSERKFMLDIKNGFFDSDVFENFVSHFYDSEFRLLEDKYSSFKPNQELKNEIDKIIMDIVKIELQSIK